MDGAELAVAGQRLEIPHSPGYPLFMWLLRISGGRSYNELRIFNCLISGLAAGAVYFALKSYSLKTFPAAAGSMLLIFSGPVFSQLNILEVHGLSLLLASVAIASRNSRSGPYAFGMSVFGGHPLSVFLFPLVVGKKWLKYWPLGLLPATMWLYVPLRAKSASVMHYGAPGDLREILDYFMMYEGRVSSPSLSGITSLLTAIGPVTAIILLLICICGKFGKRTVLTIAGVLLVFLLYNIPDADSYSWMLLLPLSIVAGSGIQRFSEKKRMVTGLLLISAIFASAVSGILLSWDRRENAMQTITSDLMRGVPFERVICITGGTSYYCAYLTEAEDRRPDLLAVDRTGLVYPFSLFYGPIGQVPPEIAGRYVYATGTWGSLPPSGLLFSVEGNRLDWSEYDVFSDNFEYSESMAGDMLAEMWVLRSVQEDDAVARNAALSKALECAESDDAVNAVYQFINRDP